MDGWLFTTVLYLPSFLPSFHSVDTAEKIGRLPIRITHTLVADSESDFCFDWPDASRIFYAKLDTNSVQLG